MGQIGIVGQMVLLARWDIDGQMGGLHQTATLGLHDRQQAA
jgi:hypothetical protein